MIAVHLEELFEICLEKLESGAGLDDILSSYPDQANELRPFLLAILEGQQLAADISPRPSVQSLSRAQFLTAAARMVSIQRKPRFTWLHLRLATSVLILVGVLAAILLGTGLASANALPGDIFYPVKLMVEQIQLKMVQDPPARLEMEENYDDRRLAEVERLNQIKRRQPVTFSGLLEQTGPDQWQVGTLPLVFPQGATIPSGLNDSYVRISGYADHDSVEVEDLEPRYHQWSGILQKYDEQSWQISGVILQVNGNTQVSGAQPQIGAFVQVTALRLSENRYLALSLEVTAGAPSQVADQPQPVIAQTPSISNATKSCSEESEKCEQSGTPTPKSRSSDGDDNEKQATSDRTTEATRTKDSREEDEKKDQKNSPTAASQVTQSESPGKTTSTPAPTSTRKPEEDKEH